MPERRQYSAKPTRLPAKRLLKCTGAKVGYVEEQLGAVYSLHPAEDPMDVPSRL